MRCQGFQPRAVSVNFAEADEALGGRVHGSDWLGRVGRRWRGRDRGAGPDGLHRVLDNAVLVIFTGHCVCWHRVIITKALVRAADTALQLAVDFLLTKLHTHHQIPALWGSTARRMAPLLPHPRARTKRQKRERENENRAASETTRVECGEKPRCVAP